MSLTFSGGRSYDFCRVPPEVWNGLRGAASAGTYYNNHIRDRYQC